ncbi:hypothetical protein [Owenweeksia hongkongensis]|uniref:hypothetical protein n=1 Tax=Owenweeksia hongkongensis TaxID=253245 RepID=UPI003A8FD59E
MSDSAKGPGAGYIYQFELALVELAKMSRDNVLSIEKMDDLAMQDIKGHYIMTIQAKHSISVTGSTFGNTSSDLWKTLVNWIDKITNGHVGSGNHFKVITNVKIPKNSIIRKFRIEDYDEVIEEIRSIKCDQEAKIAKNKSKGKNSPSIKAILSKVDKVLNDLPSFQIILSNFSYEENYQLKEDFFDSIQLGSITDDSYKSDLYDHFIGWVINKTKENWLNSNEADFTKKDFEEKYDYLRRVHPLKKVLFRSKKEITGLANIDLNQTRNDTFILQIEDIERDEDDKKEIIKEAIFNFILSDIEISYVITKSNTFTKPDYEDFKEECYNNWKKLKKKHAPHDPKKYSASEQNDIAIKIFDEIMDEIKLSFIEDFNFDNSNKYVQNGTFLQLSNEPKIGWIPSWKEKYKK